MPIRFRPLLLAAIVLLVASLVAIEGRAQIAYRSHASTGIPSTANTVITHVGPPAAGAGTSGTLTCAQTITPGIVGGMVNDLLVALVVSKDSTATTLQASAGWNTLFSQDNPIDAANPTGASYQARIYWRFATGADTLTVSRANPAAGGCDVLIGQIARFRNVNTANPFHSGSPVPAANWTYSNSSTTTSGTETTATPNAMLLYAVLIGDNDGTGSPVGFSESFDSGTGNGTDAQVSLKYRLVATPATYGPFALARGGGSDPNHGVLFALRPNATVTEGLTIARPTSPAAVVNGDVMVASVAVRPSTMVITAPTGWTQVRNMTQGAGNTSRMATFVRAVTDVTTEPASYQFVLSGGASTGAAGGIIAFSGVDIAALPPAGTEEGGNTTPSGLTHTASAITTTIANTMLVGSFEFTSTPTAANWSSTMTDRVDQGSPATVPNNDGLRLLMAHQTRAATGSTGSRTATGSGVTADTGLAFLLALRPGFVINHLSISHAGSGVACDDQTVTITAHDASHNTVNAQGISVALSTTNGKGTWTGIVAGGGTLSDPTPGDGAATYTFAAGSSSVQLSFRYANLATPSETFGFNVSGGGFSETSGVATGPLDDPSFTTAQAGFQFRNVTDGSTTIPTQIAGKPSSMGFNSNTIRLRAVRTDTETGNCVGLFASQARTVELGAECNDPASCAGQALTVNATSVATSASNGAAGAAAYTGVSLTFNASSEADTVITYPDAGQISLHARYDLDTNVAGFEMTGSSNLFVVRPFGLHLDDGAGGSLVGVAGPGGAVFRKAGQDFNVRARAVVWQAGDDGDNNGVPDSGANLSDNAATANFGQEAAPVTVTVTHTLVAPAGGASGAITGGSFTGFTGGARTNAMTWSEVGSITLNAALSAGSYLGSGVDVTGSVSPVGRFIPDHFLLTPGTFTNRQQSACTPVSTFTYQGEGFRANFMLTARNGLGTPTATTNYTTASGFAKLDATVPANFGFGAVDLADATPPAGATDLTSRLTLGTSTGTWTAAGTADINADISISRTNPDGPFESVRLGALPADTDGVTLRAADLDLDTSVPAGTNDRVLVGSTRIRFGQLAMGSRNGSQLRPLRIPVEAQYWNGASFITNVDDGCTTLAADNVALGNYQPSLDACETSVTVGAFAKGRSTIELSAPGPTNSGSVDLTANLSAVNAGSTCIAGAATPVLGANRLYLQGKWTGATYTQNPVSRARFGTYPGADEIIFSRENF